MVETSLKLSIRFCGINFPSLKHNFIAYRSSKVSDCIFEIHQLWKSVFSRVYFNSCYSCSFKAEIIKNGQLSHKMDSNNIVSFQESTTILNAHTKKSLLTYRMHLVSTPQSSVCVECRLIKPYIMYIFRRLSYTRDPEKDFTINLFIYLCLIK